MAELNSGGGFVTPAQEMARLIRGAGLDTLVNAAKERCASACTALFVAGVNRHYINADKIDESDASGKFGLGFHQGSGYNAAGVLAESGPGTAKMIDTYYEMGVPGAAGLITRASSDSLFNIAGATALETGVATSLIPP